MNLDELLQRWREGRLSAAELDDLMRQLGTVEGRKRLRLDWFLETTLPEALKAADLARAVAKVAPLKSVPWTGRIVAWCTGMRSAWRWATAAVALVVIALLAVSLLLSPGPSTRQEARVTRPDLDAVIWSTQQAIAGMPAHSLASASALPGWMSPTASLLDQPRFPQ